VRALWVAPTLREAACLPPGAIVVGSGAIAAEALRTRLADQPADIVVIAGVCGGLDPSLSAGGLILARSVAYGGSTLLTPPGALLTKARLALRAAGASFATSGLLTVDTPVATREAKAALWNADGVAGVDMETYPLVEAATAASVAWLGLRAVVDPLGQSLPQPLRQWRGEAQEGQIARELALRPQDWPATIQLGLALRRATRSLSRATAALTAMLAVTTTDQLAVSEPASDLPLISL
jgi:Phosphorylase superfamily